MVRAVGWLAQAEELASISFRPTAFALIGAALLLSRLRDDRRARSDGAKK